jgi:hypothetical protein
VVGSRWVANIAKLQRDLGGSGTQGSEKCELTIRGAEDRGTSCTACSALLWSFISSSVPLVALRREDLPTLLVTSG